MMVILAAIFFCLITLGFTLLTVMPLFLLWLMVGVYLEPWPRAAVAREDVPAEATASASIVREEALAPAGRLVGLGT